MGLFVLDIYVYSLDRLTKEAMAEIHRLRMEASMQEGLPITAITILSAAGSKKPEIRFDVSVLDYETKHAMDLRIRKALKSNAIKFQFSNASNPKLNFYYGQKRMNGSPMGLIPPLVR